MQLSCVEITFVGHCSQKFWPKIVFWEIAHCILHCKVGWCVTTLKTKKKLKKSCKLGNLSTKNCGLNAKFENCKVKDNPNVHIITLNQICQIYIQQILPCIYFTRVLPERQQRKMSARKKVQYFFRRDLRMSDRIGVGY